jgi:hypothetical protein
VCPTDSPRTLACSWTSCRPWKASTLWQAARDAERADCREQLREKHKDAEFRAIEGFPTGKEEDILALSDPPYHTAWPNPFLPEIIKRWQKDDIRNMQALQSCSHTCALFVKRLSSLTDGPRWGS